MYLIVNKILPGHMTVYSKSCLHKFTRAIHILSMTRLAKMKKKKLNNLGYLTDYLTYKRFWK